MWEQVAGNPKTKKKHKNWTKLKTKHEEQM